MHAFSTLNPAARIDFPALAICHGLEGKATARIAAIASRRTLAPRQSVFCEGDRADSVYEVVRGMLKLFKLLPDGRRQITGFLSRGHLLGLAHDERYLYTAEAVTEVALCRYPRAQFDRLIDEVPSFARRLLAATCDELRAAQDQMLLLGRMGAAEKVASFLLAMAERRASGEDDDNEILVPMARNDIADYLGLTTETVSRALTQLKREGVIAISTPSHIVLRDRERLSQLAEGENAESA
jgi:CRP/FNR family transcriptional regulator